MHVARPLISPVTDASPESPWSTDNKVCVLREMTNEGPRGEEENRKEDEDQKTAGPESCHEFQKLTHEGEEPEIIPEPCRIRRTERSQRNRVDLEGKQNLSSVNLRHS